MGAAGGGCGRGLTTYCMKLGHHERVHRRRLARFAAVMTAAAAAMVASDVAMIPAHAACANDMTFQFNPTTGVEISPAKLTVANGACVTFHNATITSAQFTVGARYKGNAPAFSDAS